MFLPLQKLKHFGFIVHYTTVSLLISRVLQLMRIIRFSSNLHILFKSVFEVASNHEYFYKVKGFIWCLLEEARLKEEIY